MSEPINPISLSEAHKQMFPNCEWTKAEQRTLRRDAERLERKRKLKELAKKEARR